MRILMVNPPFKFNENEWITVPPQGYGGIQWIIKNLIDGLIELGHEIILIGAPGSKTTSEYLKVVDIGDECEISSYLKSNSLENIIVHDHTSRGIEFVNEIDWKNCKYIIHSHYLTSMPKYTKNLVAASYSHAAAIGKPNAPIVRHPINPANYLFSEDKDDYLLYMGRVSEWKGTHCAAEFAKKVGKKLLIAGPAWEPEYFDYIGKKYRDTVIYCGEVGGDEKKMLLSKAQATLVFSGGIHIPTSLPWIEPGSQIVSESGISGTPVISSNNGCLKEIVPHVGKCINDIGNLTSEEAEKILYSLPSSQKVYENSYREWNHVKIAREYVKLYERVWKEEQW